MHIWITRFDKSNPFELFEYEPFMSYINKENVVLVNDNINLTIQQYFQRHLEWF